MTDLVAARLINGKLTCISLLTTTFRDNSISHYLYSFQDTGTVVYIYVALTAALIGVATYLVHAPEERRQAPQGSAYTVPARERLAAELRAVPIDQDIVGDERGRHILGFWQGRE